MIDSNKKVWGIHTRDENRFLEDNVIAIGWPVGDLSDLEPNRDAFKERLAGVYSDAKKRNISSSAGMLYRFCHEMQKGDYVVFPSKSNREINIGVVTGEYAYDETQDDYVNIREVKWLKHLPRTNFSQGALYELGAAMSLFCVKNYAEEFLNALDADFSKNSVADKDDETIGATAKAINENTRDFILKELSREQKGHGLEDFVADLLRAMGYRATVSPKGGDSGVDITAYKDELPPRILVQVKSKDGNTKESEIQALKGAMKEGDYGLFVTLSDYSKNAKKYLNITPVIRGINGTELANLILKYYKDLSEEYRKIIPLKQAYIPVQLEDY